MSTEFDQQPLFWSNQGGGAADDDVDEDGTRRGGGNRPGLYYSPTLALKLFVIFIKDFHIPGHGQSHFLHSSMHLPSSNGRAGLFLREHPAVPCCYEKMQKKIELENLNRVPA